MNTFKKKLIYIWHAAAFLRGRPRNGRLERRTAKQKMLGASLLLTVLATGCTTVSTPPSQAPLQTRTWPQREAILSRLQSWHLNGKIAVQTSRQSGSATVDWQQQHDHYKVSLLGPLGSHGMILTGRRGAVTLVTANGQRYSASSPESLLARNWGFHLPISHLMYWVRGLPVPGIAHHSQFDRYDRLVFLNQDGWRVNYQSYTNRRGIDLPNRMSIESPSLRSKIIIYQWL